MQSLEERLARLEQEFLLNGGGEKILPRRIIWN